MLHIFTTTSIVGRAGQLDITTAIIPHMEVFSFAVNMLTLLYSTWLGSGAMIKRR